MVSLSDNQRERVQKYAEKYLNLSSKKWEEDEKERKEKARHFQELLASERLPDIDKEKVSELVSNLWAMQIWQKKEYKVGQIVEDNGLEKLGLELQNLLYGHDPLNQRFDRFQNNVKHLGPSSITEIMCLVSPKDYCIWNNKPKDVLPFLQMKSLLPDRVYKYSIDGEEYERCNEVLGLIKDELEKSGVESPDFLDVDYFLYYVYDKYFEKEAISGEGEEEEEEPSMEGTEWDHEELTHWQAIGLITKLGNLLGYDTYVADPSKEFDDSTLGETAKLKEIPPFTQKKFLDTIKRIDVIWFKDEFPQFCFEVEHTTNITKGLLRIYQARNFKVEPFIVAPEDSKTKFKKEIDKDPFREIKDTFKFRSYKQLIEFYSKAKKYHNLKRNFL